MPRNHRPPVMNLRSKITGKGRKRKSYDVLTSQDRPKRQRTVNKEGQNNATRPIEFRELANICREGVPENGILELVSKTERFEALLVSEEIRPDLLKLVISAFRLLCSANTIMNENAEKFLRSTAAKKFITGTVLSEFINAMPFSETGWKDESDRVAVLNDLAGIFLVLLQKLGESIVHKLSLPQLSISWEGLKKKNLIEDTSDLDKKVRQVFELKDQVIRLAKSAHDQESWDEPPQDFRELSVIPQLSDLCSRPFLRENITDRRFRGLDHYLDVQSRLLREDFVIPLRDGIKHLTKGGNLDTNSASKVRRTNDVPVYYYVTFLYPVCSRKGLVYRIMFDLSHPKVRRVNWERSKRLRYGTLVCLSSDEFNTLVFATVENRDVKGLKVGELEVRFENIGMEEINQFIHQEEKFVMIESPAYFEAYRHVLEALKEIKLEEFPFQKHIVECCQDVGPPDCQVKKENSSEFKFNFTDVLVVETPTNPESSDSYQQEEPHDSSMTAGVVESTPEQSKSESGSSTFDSSTDMDEPMDQEIPSAEVKHEFTTNVFNWPDNESLGFNESQMCAFKMAMTRKFAVIQDRQGQGKLMWV